MPKDDDGMLDNLDSRVERVERVEGGMARRQVAGWFADGDRDK